MKNLFLFLCLCTILSQFACKGQFNKNDTINEIKFDYKIYGKVIAEKGDSAIVSIYLPKKIDSYSIENFNLIDIIYIKNNTEIKSKAYVLLDESSEALDTINFQINLIKSLNKIDFKNLIGLENYILKKEYEINNLILMESLFSEFRKDSIDFLYSYKDDRDNFQRISIGINFD